MTTAQQILDIARAEIGVRESPAGSNRQKYGKAYGWDGVAWCAQFVWWCFHQADAENLLPTKTASCWQMMDAAKKAGLWVTSDYKPGDVLIYKFGASYHTGICESVSGNSATAIEGNTGISNDANGGAVMRHKRSVAFVKGAVRPKYSVQKPLPLVAQEVIDGAWGNGDARVKRLTEAGYSPADVQKRVNALCKGGLRVQITADVLNIRAAPDLYAKKLDIFGAGATVHIEEVREGKGASAWGRVGNGWISLDFVREV